MKWDQEIFNRNIERLIQDKCAGIQIRFNEIVESRDAATRWKKEKPSFDSILTITEKFNTSVDDLISDPDPHKDALADFSLVPKYRARLSGGPGAYAWTQDVESHLSFKNAWLNGKCNKDAAALFEVRGDSMSPLITDGDIVLVDTSKNVPEDLVDGKIYAFSEGDRVKVKRLMWRGADLWAISENKYFATDADAKRKRSSQAKRAFKKENPCPATGFSKGSCPGYHIDHIVPLHKGGTDTPDNMQWLKEPDHREKHRK